MKNENPAHTELGISM